MIKNNELFTLKQVAENWQVSLRSVQRLVTAGKVNVIRIGRSVRVSAEELERVARFGTEQGVISPKDNTKQ